MSEVLRDFGIFLTDAGRRSRLAGSLESEGATPAEIQAICEHIERGANHDPERTGQRLALILKPERWQDALQAAHKARQRIPKGKGSHDHGETRRAEDCAQAFSGGSDDRDALYAYTALHHEGKTPKTVANTLRLGLDKLRGLVRQGSEAYGCPDPDKAVTLLFGGERAEFARWMIAAHKTGPGEDPAEATTGTEASTTEEA